MNQGIAFARTLRALDAGDFRASKLGLLAAVVLLGAWTWWTLAARVPQYESTNDVRIQSNRAFAYFSSDVLTQIHVDQRAVVHFNGNLVPARVNRIAPDHAELVLANPQSPAANPVRANASADVEISRLSPAALALRTLTRR